MLLFFFFFFQAEDGIRDADVTGVQTCALPISPGRRRALASCWGSTCRGWCCRPRWSGGCGPMSFRPSRGLNGDTSAQRQPDHEELATVTADTAPRDQRPRAGRREWTGLAVLALACLLYVMDLTVLHLAVPAISEDLRPSSTQLLWITDIYGFMVAGFLVTMGTLGDRIG